MTETLIQRAREIVARWHEARMAPGEARAARSGLHDNEPSVACALAALTPAIPEGMRVVAETGRGYWRAKWHDKMTERDIERLARDMCSDPSIRAPVQGFAGGIPWEMHMRAYEGYCDKWRGQVALIDLFGRDCRGGFGTKELDIFIPGWRDQLSERTALLARIATLEAASLPSQGEVRNAALEEAAVQIANMRLPATPDPCSGPDYLLGFVRGRHDAAVIITALAAHERVGYVDTLDDVGEG